MSSEKMGKFIAERRKEKKLTQEQLGEKLGVSAKSISRWENNITMPDISLITNVAKELDIEVSELLNGKKMNKQEINDTIDKLIKYSSYEEKQIVLKLSTYMIINIVCIAILVIIRLLFMFDILKTNLISDIIYCICLILAFILNIVGTYNNISSKSFRINKNMILSKKMKLTKTTSKKY